MKFCAVICEYNPFHNGHRYQLERIRNESGCDKILCMMSGNFTQRGETAVFDKFTRARHAVECGADAVLELPTAFAISPAEIFAKGAIKILSSVPCVTTLAFGCESGNTKAFLEVARASLSEDKAFKAELKRYLQEGTSYARARTQAILSLNGDIDEALLTSPNNILGTEYCRALLQTESKIAPLPIARTGAGYADSALYGNFSSATALRTCMAEKTRKSKKALKQNVPACVFRDAESYTPLLYETAAMCALAATDARTLARTVDCTEGLENRFKAFSRSNPDYSAMLSKMVTKRYTLSRLKRILCANLLGIREKEVHSYLSAPLYCKVLAVRKEGSEEILSALKESTVPVIVRKSDADMLKKEARDCFDCDLRANDVYNTLIKKHINGYQTLFVE